MTRIVAILFAIAQLPAFALPMIAVQQMSQYEPRRLSGSQTNMVLYLMPHSPANFMNGSGVSSLVDFSGWGHHITNGTAASQPLMTRADNNGNLLVQSETFSTTWGRTRCNAFGATDTGAAGAGSFANTARTTDPLGGNMADFVQEDGTVSNTHFAYQNTTSPIASPIRISVWAKKPNTNGRDLRLAVNGSPGFTANFRVVFDLSTHTVVSQLHSGTGANISASITELPAGSGWYLCSAVGIFSSSESVAESDVRMWNGTTDSYSGDNTSGIFLWGASLTPASWDTNYIATVATPAFAGVNGFRSLYFDGTDDYLKSAAFTWNQPETIVMGVKPWTWTVNDTLFDGNASSSERFYQSATTPNVRLTAGTPNTEVTTMGLGTNYLATVLFNGASSSVQINNGSATVSDAGAGNAGGFTLGALGTPANYGNVQSGRVLGFNRVLTANELAYVRWGEAARLGVKLW